MNPGIKRRILKWTAVIAAALVGLVLVAAFSIWLFFPKDRFRKEAVEQLSKKLHQDVSIEDMSVGFYPDLEVVAKGVRIKDRQTGEELAFIQKVRFNVEVLQLLKRKVVLEEVVVNSPEIRLIREGDGNWNVERVFEPMKGEKSAAKTSVGMSPIRIRHGTIDIDDDALPFKLSIENISGIYDASNNALNLDSATLILPFMTAEFSGNISEINTPNPVLALQAEAHISNDGPIPRFKKTALAPHAPVADVSATITGKSKNLSFTSTFSLNSDLTAGVKTAGILDAALDTPHGSLKISKLSTIIGKSQLSATGKCSNVWSDTREMHFEGKGSFTLKEISRIIDEPKNNFEPSGVATAHFQLDGHSNQFDIQTVFDLLNAGVTIPHVLRKEAGTPGTLKVQAQYVPPGNLVIEDFEFALGADKVQGQARLSPSSQPCAQVSLESVNFPLKKLNRLDGAHFDKGSAVISVEANRATPESEVEISGKALLQDADLSTNILAEPFRNLYASVSADKSRAIISEASFSLGSSLYHGEGEVSDFEEPQISGSIRTPLLNVNEIVDAIGRKSDETVDSQPDEEKDKREVTLRLLVAADSMYAGNITTGPVTTTWTIEQGVHKFETATISSFGGTLKGDLELRGTEDGLRWEAQFDGERLRLEQVAEQFHPKKVKVTGEFDMATHLVGSGGSWKDVLKSMDGNFEATARNGEIKQYAMLKNIFLLMQAPFVLTPGVGQVTILNTLLDAARTRGRSLDPTCVTYDKMEGDFTIAKGKAHTEDFRLESGIADLLFQGDLALPEKEMEMTVRAMPLGSISSLMGMIPIAGNEVKKVKETVFSADFVVRGPWADPQVKLEAAEKILGGNGK